MENEFYKDIEFQQGFRYQVTAKRSVQTSIKGFDIEDNYFRLTPDGMLTAKIGYAWDGASWCPDFDSIMRGSLFHDILYQMMRMKLIPRDYKFNADVLLVELCKEDGMWEWFAELIVYEGVKRFGSPATHPNHRKQVKTAP